jgi:urease accessory protein
MMMSDDTKAHVLQPSQTEGSLYLSFGQRFGTTSLVENQQSGCLRMRLLRRSITDPLEAVILNVGGGLVEGDRLDQKLHWQTGAVVSVTTLAAEKVYRAVNVGASISTQINVAAGADAEWLPQETILFDRARLSRTTEVRLHEDADFLGCEAVVFGRTAMGETIREGLLDDRWRIWRGGRLIYADALRLDGDIAALLHHRAIGAGSAAMAVLIYASAKAAALLPTVRAALGSTCGLAAATLTGALLVVRLLARDGAVLRQDVAIALAALRAGRPLPRVWGC